jgi:ornithine cyclodeaminase
VLVLSERDILKCVSYFDIVNAIEESFIVYEQKDFHMPNRMHIDHGPNTLLLMPCFGKEYFGTKLVTVYPGNRGTGFPVINGVVILNDLDTGSPLALINGQVLTALRTGAAGAVSVKHLAPENASQLGIIGAGVQAFYQVMSTAVVRKLQSIAIYDIYQEASQVLAQKIREKLPDVIVNIADNVEELLVQSQVVITSTTAANPVLPENRVLLEGRHFVGIGSFKPEIREFPEALYGLIDSVYVDTEHAAKESGDVLYPLEQKWIAPNQVHTLGSLIKAGGAGDVVRNKTTFFKSVGMALFDLAAAGVIYEKALEKGIGQELVL